MCSKQKSAGWHTCVVDLARASVHSLEQLVDLLLRHLLAQVGQDVLELANADEACHVFIKHLKATAIFLGLARVAESARSVQDALERLEVDCGGRMSASLRITSSGPSLAQGAAVKAPTFASKALFQLLDLGQRGVLAAGSQQIAERVDGAAAVAALVEQGKCLLVVGRGLGVVIRSHFPPLYVLCSSVGVQVFVWSAAFCWQRSDGVVLLSQEEAEIEPEKIKGSSGSLLSLAVARQTGSNSCWANHVRRHAPSRTVSVYIGASAGANSPL